jgi:tetratricopeptide (TPR) repeat protein
MAIDKALVGFLGAVAAATAAARAGRPVLPSIAADPAAFFGRLVELRGETEMKRHAERLALHLISEVKAGRGSLQQLESRVLLLTGLVCNFPPKTAQLQEELDRSRGRSPAASALLIASAMVSRAQARGKPDQARVDPSWATDLIAEALSSLLADITLLSAVERAFEAAADGIFAAVPVPSTAASPAPFPERKAAPAAMAPNGLLSEQAAVELRAACRHHNIVPADVEAVVAAKMGQLRDIQKLLTNAAGDAGGTRMTESLRLDAASALAAGKLQRCGEVLSALANQQLADGRGSAAAETAVILGQLQEARLEPQAAATAYGDAVRLGASLPASLRWSFALRQGAALASAADDLNRLGKASNGALSEAVRIYAGALQLAPREDVPELYTVTQNCLGNTLLRLGELEGTAELLEHSAAAYRLAAAAMDRSRSARDWALVHSNLGTALLKAGEIANAERNYADAATAFDTALEVLKPDTNTPDWASAEAGRGTALGRLGAIRSDLGLLERTARTVDAALASFERRSAPAPWARLQSCLGNICADLGERIGGRHWLERAIAAYEAAQQEWTEQRSPLQWALSEANRGGAQLGLGTLTGSRRHLQLAEESLVSADRVFSRMGELDYAAAARQSLAVVRGELGQEPPMAAGDQVARARV